MHFRFPLNRWKRRPVGTPRSKERTTTMIGGAPVGAVPSLSPTTRGRAKEMAGCTQRHRAMSLTAMPGGTRRGRGALGPQRGGGVCLSYYMTQFSYNRHTGNSKTQSNSDLWNKAQCEYGSHRADKPHTANMCKRYNRVRYSSVSSPHNVELKRFPPPVHFVLVTLINHLLTYRCSIMKHFAA